ncbi:MAG: hypothetical protein IAF02_09535 [Anaerolineae bacterium]|nr:hypothetical protein [Anaerolineae bacterium]
MSDEQDKVLSMLQNGTIDAEQANDLLEAMEEEGEEMVITAVSESSGDIPNMDRYRRFWVAPFVLLSATTTLLALWLRALSTNRKSRLPLSFLIVLSLFLFSLGLTVLMFMSRRSTWVHVRVKEKDGANIAISMPLPLSMASWAINYAREFVQGEALDNLDMAAAAIAAAQESFNDPNADPIMINVDDEDARVQVFIG